MTILLFIADHTEGVRSQINFEDFCLIVSDLKTVSSCSNSSVPSSSGPNGTNGISSESEANKDLLLPLLTSILTTDVDYRDGIMRTDIDILGIY